jgi:hypothetical protein
LFPTAFPTGSVPLLAAVGVLRTLEHTDGTMTYSDFARAIGLMAQDEEWHIRYRTLVSELLYMLAATERQFGDVLLPYERIVTAQEGEPGQGNYRTSRIWLARQRPAG